MVDGMLLLVDACEGPLPQTRFVLKKALEPSLPAIICINKIDRSDARTAEVLDEVYDLFIDLGADEDQLDFPILYTNARVGTAVTKFGEPGEDLAPLFEAIIAHLPGPEVDPDATLQFQANNLDYDDYVGPPRDRADGRGLDGRWARIIRCAGATARRSVCKVAHLYGWQGLKRVEVERAEAGDIVMVAGLEDIEIGETIADLENPRPLPAIRIDEPTVAMTFSVNNSPWAGREGEFVTSRKLGERIIRVAPQRQHSHRAIGADSWRVLGRGELALAVIVETMRREGYELQVSKPTVLTRQEDGAILEPMEFLVIDIPEEYIGTVTQMLSARKGRMRTMETHASGRVRLEYDVPARGLIGFRGRFLAETRGQGVMHAIFNGYGPWSGTIKSRQNGAMISDREGVASAYAIFHLQERGIFFIGAGEPVYEGMIIGEYARETNLPVNVCREKKLTNIRAAGHDEAMRLTPAAGDDARHGARMDRRRRAGRAHAEVCAHAQPDPQDRAAQQASRGLVRLGPARNCRRRLTTGDRAGEAARVCNRREPSGKSYAKWRPDEDLYPPHSHRRPDHSSSSWQDLVGALSRSPGAIRPGSFGWCWPASTRRPATTSYRRARISPFAATWWCCWKSLPSI